MRVRRKRRLPESGRGQTCKEQWRPWNFPYPWAQNHCLLPKCLERGRSVMECGRCVLVCAMCGRERGRVYR